MPRYYRRRWRPRRRYRRWFKRRFRRFVNGSSKSSVRLKVPISSTYDFTQQANAKISNGCVIHPWQNSNSTFSALTSQLYRTYCSLYDEVKCIGMKIKFNVSSPVGGTDIPSLQIWTAFDRRHVYGDQQMQIADIKTYSTYQCATAVNNSVAKLERSIYASDLLEKAQWHDCTLELAGSPQYTQDAAYAAAGANVNFFCPAFIAALCIPNTTALTTVHTTIDVMYYFSFRNPKFGASAGASRMEVETLDRALPAPRADDDGDMDDDIQIFADGTEIAAAAPSASDGLTEERTPVTSVQSSLSREVRRAGVPSATVAAAANRVTFRRLQQGGKNV